MQAAFFAKVIAINTRPQMHYVDHVSVIRCKIAVCGIYCLICWKLFVYRECACVKKYARSHLYE